MRLDFPNVEGNIDLYMKVMKAICGETRGYSMIDLGCCFAPNTPKLGFASRTYVDVIDRKLDHQNEQVFFHKADILNLPLELCFGPSGFKYTVSLCLDVIEHQLKPDGLRLLQIMEFISHKQIIFTPLGEIFKLVHEDNHDPEAHRSLWTPEMFLERGYAVIVYPDYHKIWNGGGIFAWRCDDIQQDFERVKSLL